jgi:hypothetical protein
VRRHRAQQATTLWLERGERRGSVAKDDLESRGVSASRIRTVSLARQPGFSQEREEDYWFQEAKGTLRPHCK